MTTMQNPNETVRNDAPWIRRGERADNHKLTREQVIEIRELIESGLPVLSIARRFGVTEGCIRGIRTRKNWGWLI